MKSCIRVSAAAPTFIGSWMIDRPSLCDELVEYFEEHVERQKEGITSTGKDLSVKDRVTSH